MTIVLLSWPSGAITELPPGSPVPRVGEEVSVYDLEPLDGRRGVRRKRRRGIVASVSYLLERDHRQPTTERTLFACIVMRRRPA